MAVLMRPSSAIAAPIFAAFHLLNLLGAVRTVFRGPYPLDPAWTQHSERNGAIMYEFERELVSGLGFAPKVAGMVRESWAEGGGEPQLRSPEQLDLLARLALGGSHSFSTTVLGPALPQ